jgi:hypothetical protein
MFINRTAATVHDGPLGGTNATAGPEHNMDVGNDGVAESTAADVDGDGLVDLGVSDVDGDGVGDLLVADTDFDGYADSIIGAFDEGASAVDGATSVADAIESAEGETTFSDSGDSITTMPDGSVSFSGTTVGGDSIDFNSDIGAVDYSSGFDADF